MHEFARRLSPEDFEAGIGDRINVGQIVVGQLCKIRFEDEPIGSSDVSTPLSYTEAAIAVTSKQVTPEGNTVLTYIFDATRSDPLPVQAADTFNAESVAVNFCFGRSLRSYLSDDPDPRWDWDLAALTLLEPGLRQPGA